MIRLVRQVLRERERLARMDERAASELLYPARRQVQAAPVNPPLNDQRLHGCEPGEALDELVFDVLDSTA